MPADTKLYLYLDPGGLISRAPKAWDPSQFGGWVPHQMIQYLWPTGPWYWLCDRLGVPDWVAHRLWIATLLFMAGLGVHRFLRATGSAAHGALVGALMYQLSPFVVPYVSRTSVMLLPWAALGWLLLLTRRAFLEGGWRAPAWIALVVFTAAGVNATAFAVILPAPVLWVLLEWRARRLTTRHVLGTSARIGLLASLASAWWVAMLAIQSRYGANLLGYSETLDSVAYTANSVEIMRGLGYWLFYVKDPYAAATTASIAYQHSVLLILIGFALTAVCLLGLAIVRFAHRRFALLLVTIGLVLAVGVHPYDDPSPVAGAVEHSGLALALRSSTRAIPLVVLGLGMGAAALVEAVRRRDVRRGNRFLVAVVVLVAANLPSLWVAHLVDPAISRQQDVPRAWTDAATALQDSDPFARVLQLPGAEFGSFRWGHTVDPPLPGITDKPVLTRDLLPLGSASMMDLLYALDDRIQSGQFEPSSLAPIARLLTADRIWVVGDQAYDRFRTLPPEVFAALLAQLPAGLSGRADYGAPFVNEPSDQFVDEQRLADPLISTTVAPVELLTVDDATALARIATTVVILDGSGDGAVDAASAGLLFGDEALRYANDLSADDWTSLADKTLVIVTDSNRDRDRQWRGSQDVTGLTETGGESRDGQNDSTAAVRLPVFADQSAEGQTIAVLDGDLVAQASSYGDPFSLMPEYRPAMAVDGDPRTGWRVGLRWAPNGERFTLQGAGASTLHLLQLQGDEFRKMITDVDIDVDGRHQHVRLDESSLIGDGQDVAIPAGDKVTITISGIGPRPGAPDHGSDWVGFAELGPTAQEWVRPPLTALANAPVDSRVALVFHRDGARATDRWRSDPEPRLARQFDLPRSLEGSLTVRVSVAERAPDALLDALAGGTSLATSNRRLTGAATARASAAFDNDPRTRWITPFNLAAGSWIDVPLRSGSAVDSFRILQPTDTARITELLVGDGTTTEHVTVPAPGADGYSEIAFSPIRAASLRIEIAAVQTATTTDRRLGTEVELPAGIAEIDGLPTTGTVTAPGTQCRTDLLTIDGAPIGVRIDIATLLADGSTSATLCDGSPLHLPAGTHRILAADGLDTAIAVDDVVLAPEGSAATAHSQPAATLESFTDTDASLTVPACATACWLIFGEGYNTGWTASVDGADLGEPTPIAGGSNGWLLPASATERHVTLRFAPQSTLDAALAVSAATVATCLVLAAFPLLRRRGVRPTVAPDEHPLPQLVEPWALSSPRSARRAAVVLVVASAAFISVWWGLAALPVAAALVRRRQPRLAAVTASVGFAAFGVLVAGVSIVRHTPAGMAWVGQLEPIHRSGMFLVLLLTASVVADDEPGDRQRQDTDHR